MNTIVAPLLLIGLALNCVVTASALRLRGLANETLPAAERSPQRSLQESTWQFCANENGNCDFSGTKQVRYGGEGEFFYGTFTNGVTCGNAAFGDPIRGTVKACYIFVPGPSQGISGNTHTCASGESTCKFVYGLYDHQVECSSDIFGTSIPGASCQFSIGKWVHCANENGVCNLSTKTTVRYGAEGHYVWRDEEGAVPCTNARFGDPIRGTVKTCLVFTGNWNDCFGLTCNLPNKGYTVRYGGLVSGGSRGAVGDLIKLPHVPVAAANLPDGSILTWSAATKYKNPMGPGQTYTCIFDPDTNACPIFLVDNTNHDST